MNDPYTAFAVVLLAVLAGNWIFRLLPSQAKSEADRLTRLEDKLDRLLAALDITLTTDRLTLPAMAGQILPPLADMDDIANSEVGQFLRRGQKINAIKVYREQTGMDLKNSKDAVDALEAEMKARGLI